MMHGPVRCFHPKSVELQTEDQVEVFFESSGAGQIFLSNPFASMATLPYIYIPE